MNIVHDMQAVEMLCDKMRSKDESDVEEACSSLQQSGSQQPGWLQTHLAALLPAVVAALHSASSQARPWRGNNFLESVAREMICRNDYKPNDMHL